MKLTFSSRDVLEWNTDEVIDTHGVLKALENPATPLRVKLGIDPTSSNLHLGRTIPLWRLRAFQEMGHHVDIVIGDFTGRVGDTSDKDAERPMLSQEEVEKNYQSYFDQIWMILNPEKRDQVTIHLNSTWLGKLSFYEVAELADIFSVNDFVKRELIARRLESGKRVSLREQLYPLMQGCDSVALRSDVELGGTDQRFNLLAGRALLENAGLRPQAIITNDLIAGTDGRKMSSSWGNVIALVDSAEEKFGKVLSIADEVLPQYLGLLPFSAQPFTSEVLAQRLAAGENPRDLKLAIAWSIVTLYHGEEAADHAKAGWVAQFSEHQLPENIEEVVLSLPTDIVSVMVDAGGASTRSDAKRLLEQGGVRIDGAVVTDFKQEISVPALLQVGKRHYRKIIAA
jgi:tyrosyl-tRNA synthetase